MTTPASWLASIRPRMASPGMGFDASSPAPPGATNEEDWVSWTRFDQFGIGTYARAEIANNKILSSTQPDA